MASTEPITGRCYCGGITLSADSAPEVVSYCHCSDCRRVSGAPVAAFAGFRDGAVRFDPDPGPPVSHAPGVMRWFCRSCGSPLAATYDYLPGQVYVPLGLIDQAAALPPSLHSHAESRLPWLHLDDDLPQQAQSARDALRGR
ncbi:GFA family protein [Roseobacter sinensis]|uniref:GFA family protein n=1 Tax=Roseobacter sinensis TaxID=2931391 RepID=A0ABT3BF68_9RHOB|nr:GFA family protein [Roseobacter sp. WL0113]MCV3272230.1 GFA family protein [Roseobacter sp. WL0113]